MCAHLRVNRCTFSNVYFLERLWNCKWLYIWEGGVGGMNDFIIGGSAE